MKAMNKNLLEFIARFAYNIEGLSGELKLYFSQFLTVQFSKTLSKNQIEDIENRKASQQLSHDEKIAAALSFSEENKVWCVASLHLLQAQAEKLDDRIVSRKIGQLSNELISIFGLVEKGELIQIEQGQIEQEIHQFQNRPIIKIPTKIWPLALDYSIRFAFLFGFSYWGVNKDYLALFNILFIPLFVVAFVYLVGRVHKKANLKLLDSYGSASIYKIEYQVSVNQYTWLAFFLGSSIFISYLLPDQLHILTLFGLTFYYFLYLRFFRIGRLEENELVRQLEHKKIDTGTLSVDENDEVIVALETTLNSSTSRLDAYVLESALFGALTFSGFLQIMATDLVSFQDLENFSSSIFSTAQAFIHLDWVEFDKAVVGLSNKKSLFCLVSAQSLICSIFFLAVIASRLRFSDIADKVRTSLNLAKAYNAKEEVLHDELEITGKTTKRLEALTAKVNEQLHQATLVLEEINPVMQYMQYFRNAGILVFLVILISSSLFITSVLGWAFLALAVATYLYFNRTQINIKFKAFVLRFRIEFIKRGFWLFGLALMPQVFAYALRMFFHVRETDFLFAISYFLVGLYVFAWLVLAAHVDEQFGEIEVKDNDLVRLSRWKFVKNTLAVLILIGSTGLAFRQLHLAGANVMLIGSLGTIGWVMYFVGYYLTKIKWLGIICGLIMAISNIAVLFKIQHWEGANKILLMGIICSCLLIPLVIWKRKAFHFLMIRFCIATIVINLYYSSFFNKARLASRLAYDHETIHINKMLEIVAANRSELFYAGQSNAIDSGIEQSDIYINQYGTKFGFTEVYESMFREYSTYALDILNPWDDNKKIDTILLPLALKAVRQENKILTLFHFKVPILMELTLESQVLQAMGRQAEAIQTLENILPQLTNDRDKEEVLSELNSLKGITQ
jgi:hypothetical protein